MIVRLFKPRFAPLVESGKKKQTVRPWPKRLPKVGQEISLRTWTGKPYRSKQRVLCESKVEAVDVVGIDDQGVIVGTRSAPENAFADADGFSHFDDLRDWFHNEHGDLPFIGILIKWQ